MLLLVFSVTLLVAVLLSGLAERTVLSAAMLFLLAGFLAGDGVLGLVALRPGDPLESQLAELALFSVLFTDGMRVSLPELASTWRLPGRALLLGLPLTIAAIATLAHLVVGLGWTASFLLGTALGPTDPVLAAAIVGQQNVPERLRRLLNVESGLNDGLALPVLLALLPAFGIGPARAGVLAGEVVLGVVIGVAIPWVAVRLEQSRYFSTATLYEPLGAFAIGLLVLAVTTVTQTNEFLAAFAAGITLATVSTALRESFHRFGELLAELLKLAAILVFGALISPSLLGQMPASGYLFMVLVLLVSRPFALAIALLGSGLTRREWVAAAWFGPKGFASVLYSLLILRSGIPGAQYLFHLAALVIVASIVLHSSTDVLAARWFQRDR